MDMVTKKFKLFLIVSLFLINNLCSIYTQLLHEHMTKEEIELLFRMERSKVHTVDYEVVPLIIRCVRVQGSNETVCPTSPTSEFEKPSVYLTMFGENFELYLEENNNVLFGDRTPIIKPYIDSNGNIKYNNRDYNLIPSLKMSVYHDRQKRAALTMYEGKNGRINVDGIINDTIIIRSIPTRIHEEVLNVNPDLIKPSSALNKEGKIHHHVVMKRDVQSNSKYIKPKYGRSQSEETGHGLNRKRRGLQPPCSKPSSNYKEFTVYPKILVILDYASYSLHHKNLLECIRHTLAFWNVVDLRYREMTKPKIRLNIAGVIISTEPNVTPYMEKHKASANSRYDSQSLSALEAYFAKEGVTFLDYDIVVGISPLVLIYHDSWLQSIYNWITNSEVDDSTQGISNFATICNYPRKAIALVRDGGYLFNADIAAHEIAHILGVEHDPDSLSKDHPDYKSHWKHGYLMSYDNRNKNQMHWSDKSIRTMQEFLQAHEHNHCLLYRPRVGTPYRKILPGKFLNRNDYCKKVLGNSSFNSKFPHHLSDCLHSYCFYPEGGFYVKIYDPVLEGTTCGERKICIEGDCVVDHTDPKIYQELLTQNVTKN